MRRISALPQAMLSLFRSNFFNSLSGELVITEQENGGNSLHTPILRYNTDVFRTFKKYAKKYPQLRKKLQRDTSLAFVPCILYSKEVIS